MNPHAQIVHGDALAALRDMPDESVDAVVTDPPYGLANTTPAQVADVMARWIGGDREHLPTGRGFMGKEWDGFVPPVAVWDECLRVLKPGGYALVFAGSRTSDLMGMAVRLAGFDIRDQIQWLYGSGFPKCKSVLKPAHEPVIMARKPMRSSMRDNVRKHGTGALNIEACRIPSADGYEKAWDKPISTSADNVMLGRLVGPRRRWVDISANKPIGGRWPANVILDESAARELDDGGGASRFFYTPKASNRERVEVDGVRHPTVKPLALMRYLCRLVTPPGGTVLDPFAGSGTTGEAALMEGLAAVLIEREADYVPLIHARVERVSADGLFGRLASHAP